MKRWLVALVVCVPLVAVSCSGGGSSSPASMPAAPSPLQAPSPSPTPAPGPTAENPAPQAMQGIWSTVFKDGTNTLVTLRILETGYASSSPGHSARGKIAVRGDLIDFFDSDACLGIGSYRWSLQGNLLSFAAVSLDGCGDRTAALNGYTYTRQP